MRTLTIYSLRFNVKRKPDEVVSPRDLDGLKITERLENYFINQDFYSTRDTSKKVMIEYLSSKKISSTSYLWKMALAKWGEASDVLDPKKFHVTHHIKEDDPVSSPTRALCISPERSEYALFFCEYSDRGSAGKNALDRFKSDFVRTVPSITMNIHRVYGEEEWLEAAQLMEVCVIKKKRSANIEDGIAKRKGKMVYTFRPERINGKMSEWARNLKKRLLLLPNGQDRVIEVARALDIDVAGSKNISGKITLRGEDGRETTFSVEDDFRAPYIREVIETADGNPLSDEKFVEYCKKSGERFFDRF